MFLNLFLNSIKVFFTVYIEVYMYYKLTEKLIYNYCTMDFFGKQAKYILLNICVEDLFGNIINNNNNNNFNMIRGKK